MARGEHLKQHQFKKGQSGNPKGRPKKLPDLEKLLIKVLGDDKDDTNAMEDIIKMLRAKAAKGDLRAAEILLDRAYGKAKQDLGLSGTTETVIKVVRE